MIEIGSQKQLFLKDNLIEGMTGVKLRHNFCKYSISTVRDSYPVLPAQSTIWRALG